MRFASHVLALLVVLPPVLALKSKRRFTDALSLLSKLNASPAALNEVSVSTGVALSQAGTTSNAAKAVGIEDAGLSGLAGLGGSAATVGSDAAADAVSDSIRSLFNLADETPSNVQTQAAVVATPLPPAVVVAPKAPATSKPPKQSAVPATAKTVSKVPTPVQAVSKMPTPVQAVSKMPASVQAVSKVPKTVTTKALSKPVSKPVPKKPAPVKPVVKADKTLPKPAPIAKVEQRRPPTPEHHAAPHAAAVKKQLPAPVSKGSMIAKSVATAKPSEAKAQKAIIVHPVPAHKEEKSGAGNSFPKIMPQKMQELMNEVSALRAKLASSAASIVHPPTPIVQSTAARQHVKERAPVHKPEVQEAPPTLEEMQEYHRQAEEAESRINAESHEASPSYRTPTAEQPEVQHVAPAVVAAVPEAPASEEDGAARVLTMTVAPTAPEAQNPIITAPVGPSPASFFGAIGHWFHSLFFGADPSPAPPVAPTIPPPHDPNEGKLPFSSQDIERTAQSALEDNLGEISISDDFADQEREDIAAVDRVKREDRALRLLAQTPKKPSMPAPPNFKHQAGSTHIGDFWGTLADEDADIEHALQANGDDLSEYERLRSLQDAKIQESVGELTGPFGAHLAMERRALRASASAA